MFIALVVVVSTALLTMCHAGSQEVLAQLGNFRSKIPRSLGGQFLLQTGYRQPIHLYLFPCCFVTDHMVFAKDEALADITTATMYIPIGWVIETFYVDSWCGNVDFSVGYVVNTCYVGYNFELNYKYQIVDGELFSTLTCYSY